MKAAIIYDSRTNTTEKAAGFIAEGLKKTGDIEVKCFNIDNVDFDYVAGVDMAIFGSPTYMASVTGKMKNWLELNVRKLGLAGKLGELLPQSSIFTVEQRMPLRKCWYL